MRPLLLLLSVISVSAADLSRLGIRELAKPDVIIGPDQVPGLASAAYAAAPTDAPSALRPVFRLSDIPFLGPDRKEKLDLYYPPGDFRADRPAVVFIHGGGFTGGDKAEYRSASVSADLCRAGYVVISCNYVLGPKSAPGVWPRNIADCREAVRWVRGHAKELGVHPERIAVAGGSAGGYLALMVGLSDDRTGPGGDPSAKVSAAVSAVIDFYGVTDFSKHGKGAVPGADADAEHRLVPANNVDAKDPPVLVLHGTADTTVDLAQSESIVAALRGAKVSHEFIVVSGAPHTFDLHPRGTGWVRTTRRYAPDGSEAEEVSRSGSADLSEAVLGFLSRTLRR